MQVLAFINDEQKETGFSTIVMLTKSEFERVDMWAHPDTQDIMNAVVRNPKVLPLPEILDTIKTTKFIPIPLLLVLMFLEHKRVLSAVEAFQVFYDFYDKASSDLRKYTEFIFNFLLVAMGYDTKNMYDNVPISQLVVSMEENALDSIIMQWASSQFGGIKHIAATQEAVENWAALQNDFSIHHDQDEMESNTEDLDQENCCAIGA